MRYLWIEDFDGGKSGQTEVKSRLEKYFQLEDKNINLCTLEEALSFLDVPENWEKFDVILLISDSKLQRQMKLKKKYIIHIFRNFNARKVYRI